MGRGVCRTLDADRGSLNETGCVGGMDEGGKRSKTVATEAERGADLPCHFTGDGNVIAAGVGRKLELIEPNCGGDGEVRRGQAKNMLHSAYGGSNTVQMEPSASIRDVLKEVKRLIAGVNFVQEVLADESFRAERGTKKDNSPSWATSRGKILRRRDRFADVVVGQFAIHLAIFVRKPDAGPSSRWIFKALKTSSMGPTIVPSSAYHRFRARRHWRLIHRTRGCMDSGKRSMLAGSPCWVHSWLCIRNRGVEGNTSVLKLPKIRFRHGSRTVGNGPYSAHTPTCTTSALSAPMGYTTTARDGPRRPQQLHSTVRTVL